MQKKTLLIAAAFQFLSSAAYANTTLISNSGNYSSELLAGAENTYKFVLNQAATLEVSSNGNLDTKGFLYNDNGDLIGQNDDGGNDANFSISKNLTPSTYYIKVKGFNRHVKGSYSLNVNIKQKTTDNNNSFASAQTVELNAERNSSIDFSNDSDFFKIDVPKAGNLSLQTLGDIDTVGTLYYNGKAIKQDTDSGRADNFSFNHYVNSNKTGTYYLKVNGYNAQTAGEYTVKSIFKSATQDDYPNRIINTEHETISKGSKISLLGNLSSNDVDFIKIYIPEDGVLNTETFGVLDTFGELYTEDGTLISSNDDNGTGHNFSITNDISKGFYYIKTRGYNKNTEGNYKIEISLITLDKNKVADQSNVINGASLIDINSMIIAEITPNDLDFFKVVIPTDGVITLFSTGSTDTFAALYDANGEYVAANDDQGENANYYIRKTISAGTYFIKTRGFNSSTAGKYHFHIQFNE